MASTHVFPQTGDNDDAENFAQLIGQTNLQDYVEQGMGLTPDYTNLSVSIGTGLAFIGVGSQAASSTGESRLSTTMAVQLSSATKSLTDTAVNHIYVEPDISTDDSAYYAVYTNTGNASADALKIGEVDTSNNTSTELNRAPDLTTENITARDGTTIWDYANGYIPESSVQQGSGSGLDADLLDGNHAGAFVLDSGDSMSGTLDAYRIDTNGTTGAASSHGTRGIGSPTIYTSMVEAPTEKGSGSTYVEIGSGGYHTSVGADEIALVTGGSVRAKSNNAGDFTIEGTYTENASL